MCPITRGIYGLVNATRSRAFASEECGYEITKQTLSPDEEAVRALILKAKPIDIKNPHAYGHARREFENFLLVNTIPSPSDALEEQGIPPELASQILNGSEEVSLLVCTLQAPLETRGGKNFGAVQMFGLSEQEFHDLMWSAEESDIPKFRDRQHVRREPEAACEVGNKPDGIDFSKVIFAGFAIMIILWGQICWNSASKIESKERERQLTEMRKGEGRKEADKAVKRFEEKTGGIITIGSYRIRIEKAPEEPSRGDGRKIGGVSELKP